MIETPDAETFERCMSVGGVAVFPSDTVYGLGCDPSIEEAVRRLYGLKWRRPERPSAVMFFSLELALAALPEIGWHTARALRRLLPGPVMALVPNPARRFPLACGPDPETLGVRVPLLAGPLQALAGISWPVLQTSANRSGEPDARLLEEVPEDIRAGADLVLDGGELPGTVSTIVDLRRYEKTESWSIVRDGAVSRGEIETALSR